MTVSGTLVLSALTWRFLEKPALARKVRTTGPQGRRPPASEPAQAHAAP